MTNNSSDKFNNVEEVYVEMEKFIHYLAGRNSSMVVEYDDIVQELMVELVKGVQAYPSLQREQLKAVLRKMMDNRIAELRYRYYVTHRKQELFNISIDMEINVGDSIYPFEELLEGGDDPAVLYESKERVMQLRNMLSLTAQQVFDSLIFGNNQIAMLAWLSAIRAKYIFGSRVVRVRPWHIADALCLEEKEVKAAIREIKSVWRVYNE